MKRLYIHHWIAKRFLALGLIAGWVVGGYTVSYGQTTWTGTSSNAWLTTGNWSPAAYPTGASAQAYFNNTTQVSVGINMGTLSSALTIGALNFGTGATSARTLNNSSPTAGILTLAGITLNSINNTVIWQQSTGNHNISNGSGTLGVALGNATDNVVAIDGTGTLTINSIISGTGKLTKSGSGTGALILTGANTFSGGLVLNSGALQIKTSGQAFGAGNLTFNGGSFDNTNGSVINLSPTTLTQTWGSGVNFLGSNSLGLGNGAVSLSTNSTVTVGANTLTAGGVVSGAFGLTKNGGGVLALSGTNTYTGKTVINAGSISMSNESRLGANPASFTADQITLNGGAILSSFTPFSFSSNRGITLGASGGSFTIASGHTVTLATVTTGAGALTKGAAGTLIMTGSHTYTGLTTVSAGTLNLNRTGGGTLPSTNDVTVASGATLIVSSNQTLNNLTVAAGGTVTVNSGVTLTINGTYSVSSNTSGNAGTILINGTLQVNEGGWPGNTGTFSYGSNGTLLFANTTGPYGIDGTSTWWPASNGPANVTVQGGGGINLNGISRTVPSSGTTGTFLLVTGVNAVQGNALTLNGTVQINGGNFQSSPIYGSSSLLKYNVNATYGRSNEWVAIGVGTIGSTPGYPNDVQLSNNTVLNLPNGINDARACARDLTIDAGSNLYADYSGGNVGLTVGRNINIAGGISLGGSSGGDLTVKGNFTRTGTFTTNGRAVFFNAASGDQTITGATTFAFVIVDKTAGNVVLANDITCTGTLTLTNGKISTGSNKVIISSSGSISRTNGWVIGFLQKNAATGATTRTFEIGDATNYTPLSISFGNVTAAGDLTANVNASAHPNRGTSTLSATKYVARYWTVTNSGTTFNNYAATFNYLSGDIQGSASTSALLVGKYDGSTWTYPAVASTTSTSVTTTSSMTAFSDFFLAEAGCISPTAFNVTGGGAYCSGGTGVAIGLSNSETGVDYQLILSAANDGSPVSGTNSAISFGLRTVAGTYTVLGTRTVGGCSTTMTGNAVVTVNPRPTVAISNKVADDCMLGVGAVTITGSGGTGTLSITWTATANASRPVGATGSATGTPAGTAQTSPVTYTGLTGWFDYIFLVTDSNGCTAPSIGTH